VPVVPTANSLLFTIRSKVEPPDAPVATTRDDSPFLVNPQPFIHRFRIRSQGGRLLLFHPLPRAVRIEELHGLSRLLGVPAQVFLINHSIVIYDKGHNA